MPPVGFEPTIASRQAVEDNTWDEKENWRKFCNEELHNLCFSTNIASLIKLKSMRHAKFISRGERTKIHRGFWYGNLRKTDHLEDICVDWRIILKRI
jgi:hypothetical protein